MSSSKKPLKQRKSRNNALKPRRLNSWQMGHPHSRQNVFGDNKDNKKKKDDKPVLQASNSMVDSLSWKTRYDKEKKEKKKLTKRIESYENQIKALKMELKQRNNNKDNKIQKKIKQIEKNLKINQRKLKLAMVDMEKTASYYRKQIEKFKTKQNKLLKQYEKNASNSTKKKKKKKNKDKDGDNDNDEDENVDSFIKYVFVEDIKEIKLRGKGKNGGIRINFVDGEEAVFNDIDVVIPQNVEDDYKNVLEEIKYDDKLLNDDKDILNQNDFDYESMQYEISILSQELQKRIEDIENLSNHIFEQKNIMNDTADDNESKDESLKIRLNIIKSVEQIKSRHDEYKIDENHTFNSNNGLWRNLLLNFPIDIICILGYELNDRIHDLLNVKDVLFKEKEALYQSIDDIIIDIEERHKDTFNQWEQTKDTHKMMNKWNSIINEVNINNTRWRQQIKFDNDIFNEYNECNEDKENNEYNEYDEFLDSLKVNQHTVRLLNYIAGYLNRIIPTSDDLQPKELQKLYVPISIDNPRDVIMACLDGILFATLINLVEPDFIDLRALYVPKSKLSELSELQISQNMTTIFASLRALDLQLPHWSVSDYLDPDNTTNIILSIIFQLFHAILNAKINLNTYPELMRLCHNDKEKHNAPNWQWNQWLNKWLLYIKKIKSTKDEEKKDDDDDKDNNNHIIQNDADLIKNILHTTDYHEDLIFICCCFDEHFLTKESNKQYEDDIFSSQIMLKCIKNVIGAKTIICVEDISSRNPLLQEILLSDIFEANNKIEKINNMEIKRLTTSASIHIATKEEKSLMAWMNALSDTKLHITNLQDSLNDGIIILKILDKLKPGCVNWNAVRQKDQIRHKFDKLTNCKLIMDICNNKFSFSLVGMGSNDITDGNLKYIRTLIWQMMRFDSTKLLSELQFNGKMVTDKMLLQWANKRVENYKKYILNHQNNSNKQKLKLIAIKSFRDKELRDSIFFLNLLASIHNEWVNYDLVYDIPSSSNNNNNNDSYSKQRLLNAKYSLTIIRKLGGEIFVSSQDICNSDPKALLSVIASIMTIAIKHSNDDELKFIGNNDLILINS